jgi:hypothetical protein
VRQEGDSAVDKRAEAMRREMRGASAGTGTSNSFVDIYLIVQITAAAPVI